MRIYLEPNATNGGGLIYRDPLYGDAGLPVYTDGKVYAPASPPSGSVQIPLPGGQVIAVAVTPAQTPAATAPLPQQTQEAVDKFRAWLEQETIYTGVKNKWIAGGGIVAFLLLRGRGRR